MTKLYEITEEMVALGQDLIDIDAEADKIVCVSNLEDYGWFILGKEYIVTNKCVVDEDGAVWRLEEESTSYYLFVPKSEVDEELSKAFQEAVFESGGCWFMDEPYPKRLDRPFLYVNERGALTFSHHGEDYFKQAKHKEITFTYKRKLEWEATEIVDERACKREEVQKVVDNLQTQLSELQEQLRVAQEELNNI